MSKRLRDIPTSCKMFDSAISELKYIERIVEPEVWKEIEKEINAAIEYIEEGRSINGELRDTCSDIANEKNEEIGELCDNIQELKEEYEQKIDEMEDEIYRLKELLPD